MNRDRENDARRFASESVSPTATPDVTLTTPLAMLLSRHVLRDGETILLAIKPSVMFVPFACLRFWAVVLIFMISSQIFNEQIHYHARLYEEVGVLLLAGRLATAVLQWIGMLYVLTDLRVIQISGVFNSQVYDCPLRKIARVRLIYTLKERLLGLGSLEIIPFEESFPVGIWQTISRPREVYKIVVTAVRKAKQGM